MQVCYSFRDILVGVDGGYVISGLASVNIFFVMIILIDLNKRLVI